MNGINQFRAMKVVLLVSAVMLVACIGNEAGAGNATTKTKDRLIERAQLMRMFFLAGDVDTFVSMWSERMRGEFRTMSKKNWDETVKMWKDFVSVEKPRSRILDVEITGPRARIKMEVTVQSAEGWEAVYDHWVYENGDWYLDDADRTE